MAELSGYCPETPAERQRRLDLERLRAEAEKTANKTKENR